VAEVVAAGEVVEEAAARKSSLDPRTFSSEPVSVRQ
jgi:hypothetical protein